MTQLQNGSPTNVVVDSEHDTIYDIAMRELTERKFPIKLIRYIGNEKMIINVNTIHLTID